MHFKPQQSSNKRNNLLFSSTSKQPYNSRGQSPYDNHIRRQTYQYQIPQLMKLSNSKTTLDICPTDRSQSENCQNSLLGNQRQAINGNIDGLQSPRNNGLSNTNQLFNIKTYIRFRPQKINIANFSSHIQHSTAQKQIQSNSSSSPQKKIAIIDKKKILCEDNFFTFDHVFEAQSIQQKIYENVCKQMVQHFVRGFNSTIFTYGQTGSGKTYTMFGNAHQQKNKGIIPQAIKEIFQAINPLINDIEKDCTNEAIVSCSMLQIYKQQMIDLLSPHTLSNEKFDLKIKQNQIFNVSNLTIKQVLTQQEMFEVLKIGNESKKIRQTCMNEASSRSHVIFTIYLQVKKQSQRRLSKFNLVDLAGSEKVHKSKVQGQGLEQAKKINLSLSCLGNTINALLKGNDHIPYRQSKLTRLLYQSLGGNSLTRLVVTCSSQDSEIEETISSLKFASRVKNLKTNPLINTLRKSQKSVSRIAFENLKTNLHKAQNKLKKVQNLIADFSKMISNENPHVQSDKENSSFFSNKQDLSNLKPSFQLSSLQKYKSFFEDLAQIFSNSQLSIDMPLIQKKTQKTQYFNDPNSNPFLLITEEQVKTCKKQPQHNLIKIDSKIQSITSKTLPTSLSKTDPNFPYWQIIKKQEKQLEILRKKFCSVESYPSKDELEQSKHSIPHSKIQIRKDSLQINFKNIDKEFKKTRKLNVKLGKILPVREIDLTSPTHASFSNPKNFSSKPDSLPKKLISKKIQQISISKSSQKSLHSPREFTESDNFQNISKQIKNDTPNLKIQMLLSQISQRLTQKNQYEKFQKQILLRQLQLLLSSTLPSIPNSPNPLPQSPKSSFDFSDFKDPSLNLVKSLDKNKLLQNETQYLLVLQTKYIEMLENVLGEVNKQVKEPAKTSDRPIEKVKAEIHALKMR